MVGTHVGSSSSLKRPSAAFAPSAVVHPRMAAFGTLHGGFIKKMFRAAGLSPSAVEDGVLICRTVLVIALESRQGAISRTLPSKCVVSRRDTVCAHLEVNIL